MDQLCPKRRPQPLSQSTIRSPLVLTGCLLTTHPISPQLSATPLRSNFTQRTTPLPNPLSPTRVTLSLNQMEALVSNLASCPWAQTLHRSQRSRLRLTTLHLFGGTADRLVIVSKEWFSPSTLWSLLPIISRLSLTLLRAAGTRRVRELLLALQQLPLPLVRVVRWVSNSARISA